MGFNSCFFFTSLLVLSLSSIPNLDTTDTVYIAPKGKAYMQITSNPTTGYMWSMIPPNSAKLIIEEPLGTYTPATGHRHGAAGTQTFMVECTELCQDGDIEQLIFVYARSWETEPVNTKYIKLMITNNPFIQ